jgi:Rrf2 family protein
MIVSQKSLYALRAIFELAKQQGNGPIKIADIAKAQAIPPRFLEVILNQLKQGGFVESRRGNEGGYMLGQDPANLTVGDIIVFIQGPIGPIECLTDRRKEEMCPLHGDCVFKPMWEEVREAIAKVYDKTTFASLVEQEKMNMQSFAPTYCI